MWSLAFGSGFSNFNFLFDLNFMSSPKKKNHDVDLDVRPKVFFKNYDYTNDITPNETSPGGGLFHGPMSRFKSVTDFLEKKKKSKKRIKAYLEWLGLNSSAINSE